jgi:hypothetical protein
MIQRGENLRFPLEAGEAIRIKGEIVREDLEGDIPAQRGVARFPDLAHAAGPDGRLDLIRAEANAGPERHRLKSGELYPPQN